MTAAGIVRSLWSCLCTSALLEVDGAEHGAADKPGAARWRVPLPGQRLPFPNLRLSDPALRAEPSGGEALATPTGPVARTAARLAGPGEHGLLPR
jgi:hypothetical protein